jgi:uncharacterized protein (TIGR03086 family)
MSQRETVLLAEAVRYALGSATLVDRSQLSASTPCPGWNLDDLLRHLADSIAVLDLVITGTPPPPVATADPVELLRDRAAGLLWTSFTAEDRTHYVVPVIAVGAIEITVHAWDVAVACAAPRLIPSCLASPLLSLAARLIPERDGLFGPPLPTPPCANPGDKLIAWLGRDPSYLLPASSIGLLAQPAGVTR